MVTVNPASAIKAYSGTARTLQPSEGATGNAATVGLDQSGDSFSSLVQQGIGNAIDANKNAEALSLKAVSGHADIADIVTAVNNAELTLQTVVAVRDKVVNAYQEIMRMPI